MTLKQTLRIAFDITMITLLLCAYNPQFARETAHIYIGVAIIVLLATHIFINRHWFGTMLKGKYTPRRIGTTAVNIVLALVAVTLIISGILEARWKDFLMWFERDITLRQVHTTAAYWFWPLMGVHLGLHWGTFTKYIGKNNFIVIVMRILACFFAAFGVWSFFDRDMFSKLFLGFSFDYWPHERPVVLFFAVTLSIMGLFAFMSYYFMKLIGWLKNKKSKP